MKKFSSIIFVCLVLILSACARDLSSNVYTSDSTLSLTMEGKILSVRPITIKDSDRLGDNAVGGLAGGALGGVAASSIGKGSGNAAAVVGGAVAGAVVGAVAQDMLSTSEGFEYIVKVDTKNLKSDYYEGSGAMRKAISSATTSGLVTVIQGKDVVFDEGQPVYVIFSDKRVRVIAQ